MSNNEIQVNNVKIERLERATQLIYSLEESTKRNLYAIATTLRIVDEKKLYEEREYKSTAEYGEAVHGYKRQTTQALIKVAKRFLIGNCSNLKRENEKDFTVYQLMELLPMSDTQIDESIEQGELNPYMTTKAIRDLVKSYKTIETKDVKNETTEQSNSVTTEQNEQNEQSDSMANEPLNKTEIILNAATNINKILSEITVKSSRTQIFDCLKKIEKISNSIIDIVNN